MAMRDCKPHASMFAVARQATGFGDATGLGKMGGEYFSLSAGTDIAPLLRGLKDDACHAPHWGYALSGGRMKITDERGVRGVDLAAGSSFASAGVAWHEVLNVGDTTVAYLIVEPKAR